MSVRILALVGSLRSGSHNRQLAEAAVRHAPEGTTVELYEGLADIPFYNEDIDTDSAPASAVRLREAAGRADALILFTPEYNGTMPAVLKNGIDWLSRPYGQSAVSGKPTAVVGTAFGQYGGAWAQEEARKAAGIAGAGVLADLKLTIPNAVARFAETHPADDGEITGQLVEIIHRISGQVASAAAA
ncbi:NADPH-dependent FMN reductase [Streptomyces genisteinicus]|uniref:NAD(P)H-dependent oxidoreductase n=1 Tax=Streptomyces genisteinicus TaxID=2768068 RepID=A0A7H0HM84_9ACTN|nr:NADPH-dependent FMN reductase [Streptomyces genisteinicus]QNP61650.1 NAD(P)H-dependent oxidoreductase [Streptomyces genisteinicus]